MCHKFCTGVSFSLGAEGVRIIAARDNFLGMCIILMPMVATL
jgi:hypothetical protein